MCGEVCKPLCSWNYLDASKGPQLILINPVLLLQGLRVHDNPALLEACRDAKHVYPVFIIDPHFLSTSNYK